MASWLVWIVGTLAGIGLGNLVWALYKWLQYQITKAKEPKSREYIGYWQALLFLVHNRRYSLDVIKIEIENQRAEPLYEQDNAEYIKDMLLAAPRTNQLMRLGHAHDNWIRFAKGDKMVCEMDEREYGHWLDQQSFQWERRNG